MILKMGKRVSSLEKRQFESLAQWPLNSTTKRVVAEMQWTTKFTHLVETEYRKFIFLAAVRPHFSYGMTGPVDAYWHQHVLNTRDYLEMCHAVAGHVIHHLPTETESRVVDFDGAYGRTLSDLEEYFGSVSGEIWPRLDQACRSCQGCKAAIDKGFDRQIAF